MKKIVLVATLLLSTTLGFAQAYSNPESVEFDFANNRWLIANQNAGNVLARNSANGAITVFAGSMSSPHGLEIVNDTLYVCDGAMLRLYNVNTAASLGTIPMGATFLNGITHDNTYLYATDFTAKKIYRINIATRAYSIFVTGLAKSPNGIIYDQPNNRCVFVNWGASAPIMAMDVTTAATSTIVATTLSNCDGIAKDGAGNYYVSDWGANSVVKYNNTFSTGPTTVVTALSSPADIFYNQTTDTLGVPNSGSANNTKYYWFGSATSVNEITSENLNITVSPNPVSKTATIDYELKADGKVIIQLFDLKGALVKTISEENQPKGKQMVFINKSGIAAGTYLLKITTGTEAATKKIIITE